MSKDEFVTVTHEQMDKNGEFTCPKCKIRINPDHDEDWEDITESSPEFPERLTLILLIKHACGQKIKIDMTGFVDGGKKCDDVLL